MMLKKMYKPLRKTVRTCHILKQDFSLTPVCGCRYSGRSGGIATADCKRCLKIKLQESERSYYDKKVFARALRRARQMGVKV